MWWINEFLLIISLKDIINLKSSLASTILATQEKPKVVAEEKKEQSSLIKALQEQIIENHNISSL